MLYRREDFSVRYSCRDYSVLYKGKSIGGGVTLPEAKIRNTKGNRQCMAEFGQATVNGILEGRISAYMQGLMDSIDEEATDAQT